MTTKIINVKHWRENMTRIWEEARGQEIRIIVMNHSMPMFKVEPVYEKEVVIEDNKENADYFSDWSQEERFKIMEKSLDFWKSDDDDNIFDESISL